MAIRVEKIAVIGDLHGKWTARDNEYFDSADYDLLLFVGDLGAGTLKDGLSIVRMLAALRTPALVLPGNNDALYLPEVHAELAHQSGKAELMGMLGGTARAGISSCGFSSHLLVMGKGGAEREVTLVAARPCAMGGSEFSFREQVKERHGIGSLEESLSKLRLLVDNATTEALIFLAHNGPLGLGGDPTDLWGRDFALRGDHEVNAPLDWGDEDLRDCVEYARNQGKQVLCVIAGHMHRKRDGSGRPLMKKSDGTIYVNPAVVPRITHSETGAIHHHVSLTLEEHPSTRHVEVLAEDRFVEL